MRNTKSIINNKPTKPATKKKKKKVAKPAYVVDLTNVKGEFETTLRFALCKYENNINNFTVSDMCALRTYAKILSLAYAIMELANSKNLYVIGCGTMFVTEAVNCSLKNVEVKKKKPNIFKRFWNWLTHKK